MSGYEPISVYDNYFVGIDGESTIGDEYSLLDSSLDEYPRLYTGKRLTTLENLDWLWGLGKHAGFCVFVLYGARYDYDNWLRDIDDKQLVEYHSGMMIRIGPYAIINKAGYKFELRRVAVEKDGVIQKWERIRSRQGNTGPRIDKVGLTFWDVLPFWQSKFTDAVQKTLGSEAQSYELIELGKSMRGSFTHDNIEWVSKYNKAECLNLAQMMVKLDEWFFSVGIKPQAYNGPGAAAKALLLQYRPFEHAGRRTSQTRHKVSEYVFPGWNAADGLIAARSAYAGGRNQMPQMGYRPGTSYAWDINSAYPSAMVSLPCLSHGRWRKTLTFDPQSFGLWKIRYKSFSKPRLYPFAWRADDGSIAYPSNFTEKWVYTSELEAGLAVDPDGIAIREGRVWEPDHDRCTNPYPFWWVGKLSADRLRYKSSGAVGPAHGLKLPLNSLYGSIAQARGSAGFANAPWTQQMVWAGAITALTRTRLYLAAMLAPDSVYHMATDGLITGCELPIQIGEGLGEWERSTMTDLTLVQYGIYFCKEKYRYRGFDLSSDDVPSFVSRIHSAWESPWRSIPVSQRLFVTSGLVATGGRTFDKWCTWEESDRTLNLDIDTPYEQGAVLSLDRLYEVQDMTDYHRFKLGASKLYEPKWSVGYWFPYEQEDALEAAFELATVA